MQVCDMILQDRREPGTWWVINHHHPSNPTNMSNVDARIGLLVQGENEVMFTPGQMLANLDFDSMRPVSDIPVEDWDDEIATQALNRMIA